MEAIKPSVWRSARRNTARSVSAEAIARSEQWGCPPGAVRGSEAVNLSPDLNLGDWIPFSAVPE